ncbi:hypothetical protein [Streptomyces sp. NPDC002537]
MLAQPGCESLSGPGGEDVDGPVGGHVDQDGRVLPPVVQGELVDTEDLDGTRARLGQ